MGHGKPHNVHVNEILIFKNLKNPWMDLKPNHPPKETIIS